MIDTISGYISLEQYKYLNLDHLTKDKNRSIKKEGYSITFNLKNFKLTLKYDTNGKPNRLYFNGSLPKFYFNNNLGQLDWDTTKEAVKILSEELKIDLDNAILTRIDIGINIILKKPIHQYISCIVDYPRLEWLRYKNSVTFHSKKGFKKFIFYDKIKEIKSHKNNDITQISLEYLKLNILRYELCLYQLSKQELKSGPFQLKNLFDDTVQKKLVFLLLEGYKGVNKLSIGLDPKELLEDNNGLNRYLSYHGINKIGYNRFINLINDLTPDVKNPSVKRSLMKKKVNELLKEVQENTLDENLVGEMDNKIKFIQTFI